MKTWKRKLGMIMTLIILAGALMNGRFTVMAADNEGPLRLEDSETWEPDVVEETPVLAEENSDDESVTDEETYNSTYEDPVEEETVPEDGLTFEETPSEDGFISEVPAEKVIEEAEEADLEEEEAGLYDLEEESEWIWDEELDFDDHENPICIKSVTAKLKLNGNEYDAEVKKGEQVREADCVMPATYVFTATVNVGSKEYTDEKECGFGDIPSGHDLDLVWKLGEDAAHPYYYPDWDKKLHCTKCGQDVSIICDEIQLIDGDDRAACDHDVTFRLGMWYALKNEEGERRDIRPFFVESPELTLHATGVHTFMRNNDTPWWDWQYDEENDRWTVAAVFFCGDEGREIRYPEDSEEVTLTDDYSENMHTYTATFKSDKFYNALTRQLDRSVEFVTTKNFTVNRFEISGVEDVLYTGKPITFENLWVGLSGRNLQEGADYTVKYTNNKDVGTATLTINGKGRFKGSVDLKFHILPVDISTENFEVHDLTVLANGKVQKKASPLYWNGAVFAKSNYSVIYDDTSAGAYKDPGDYNVTIKAKNKNFKGRRTYSIFVMDPGSGDDKIIDASKLKVNINQQYLKANPWGDCDWSVFDERDEEGNRKAYSVTYNNNDVSLIFQDSYFDIDGENGKGVLTIVADPMRWVDVKDKRGNTYPVHFGGSISKNVNLSRTDISTLTIQIPPEIEYCGHSINRWDLQEHYGFMIIDENYSEPNEEGEMIKKPLTLNMDEHYKVALKNNNKAGKMTVTITGQRGYKGKVTKTINITKVNLNDLRKNGLNDFDKEGSLLAGYWWHDEETDTDHFEMPDTLQFSKGGSIVHNLLVGYRDVNVWYEGEIEHRELFDYWLNPATDYKISYNYVSRPPKAGENVELVISGKGNYTGEVKFQFAVVEKAIFENIIEAQDVALGKAPAATMKPYLSKITVTDSSNGKVLQQGKDYTVEYFRPTFDDEGNLKDESEWISINAGTKWSDVFSPEEADLQKDGLSLLARVKAVEGSGYVESADYWYNIVKSVIKPAEFKLKDQTLALNPEGDYDPSLYFMPGEDPINLDDYIRTCTDAEYKAWADKYFVKYPSDCRFCPDLGTLKNCDKAGTASVTIRVMDNWEWDCNTGCRGGNATLKFKVTSKDVVK